MSHERTAIAIAAAQADGVKWLLGFNSGDAPVSAEHPDGYRLGRASFPSPSFALVSKGKHGAGAAQALNRARAATGYGAHG